MKKVVFEFEGIAPSENLAIRTSRYGGNQTKRYKAWLRAIFNTEHQSIAESEWYKVSIDLYFPIYYKNGNIKRKDAHNYAKYTIDPVFGTQKIDKMMFAPMLYDDMGEEIDDCRIIETTIKKHDSEDIKTVITIEVC